MNQHIILQSASLHHALERLNSITDGVMTLLVTDSEGAMTGTLTDGDVRRALLKGHTLDQSVESVMHRNFRALRSGAEAEQVDLLREIRAKGIRLVPVLDSDGHILRLLDTHRTRTILPVSAVLMAGGKGERLRPLTLTTPKPLLKVGEKAIIDYNIDALRQVGITDISVTVNYMAQQLEDHFADTEVKCVRETLPLGTLGSVTLVPLPAEGDTLVMNSDLLTTIDFEEMYLHHKSEQAAVTIAAVPYGVSIPYAILATEGSRVTSLEEKPSYSYFANAGIYLFDNALLQTLPAGERTDAPTLIEQAIARGLRVTFFPINGMWIDIGSPTDYAHACQLMKHAAALR